MALQVSLSSKIFLIYSALVGRFLLVDAGRHTAISAEGPCDTFCRSRQDKCEFYPPIDFLGDDVAELFCSSCQVSGATCQGQTPCSALCKPVRGSCMYWPPKAVDQQLPTAEDAFCQSCPNCAGIPLAKTIQDDLRETPEEEMPQPEDKKPQPEDKKPQPVVMPTIPTTTTMPEDEKPQPVNVLSKEYCQNRKTLCASVNMDFCGKSQCSKSAELSAKCTQTSRCCSVYSRKKRAWCGIRNKFPKGSATTTTMPEDKKPQPVVMPMIPTTTAMPEDKKPRPINVLSREYCQNRKTLCASVNMDFCGKSQCSKSAELSAKCTQTSRCCSVYSRKKRAWCGIRNKFPKGPTTQEKKKNLMTMSMCVATSFTEGGSCGPNVLGSGSGCNHADCKTICSTQAHATNVNGSWRCVGSCDGEGMTSRGEWCILR
eukprot:TRINITY_DN624_c0_g1_i1.p1 TRINITY_DN624_c0_g1~~TRINITY_DN624_c0_g1_i1.p1  ORF type:complete len:458 (+),score=37.88 TRINITY_DN624_c0_g1_i1:92-1375(+)